MNTLITDKIFEIGNKLFDSIAKIIDRLVPDKNLNEKIKTEIYAEGMKSDYLRSSQLVQNELNSTSKFVTWWRPAIMWICVIPILFFYGLWNNLIYPFVMMLKNNEMVVLQLDISYLILIGTLTGFYVISRSVEKVENDKKQK